MDKTADKAAEIKLTDELVARVQQNDKRAFEQLFSLYHKRVVSAAYAIVRNQEDAREIAQEAFIRVYNNIAKYQPGTHFYTWIYHITVNLAIDRYRRKKTQHEVEFDNEFQKNYTQPDEVLPPSLGINPEKVFQQAELREQLNKALDSLSEKHRTLIVLCEIEELSYKEIAETLNIPIGTVMSGLHNARLDLQKALRHYVNCSDVKR